MATDGGMKLGIVTATTNVERAMPCIKTWIDNSLAPLRVIVLVNGAGDTTSWYWPDYVTAFHVEREYMGSVPAFRRAIDAMLIPFATDDPHDPPDVIAAFHDDVEIHEMGWDRKVLSHFMRHPKCGLAGFGGALGLGDQDIYQKPYEPVQLARVNFRSNLVDAEVHGIRSLVPEQVACLDGFSQIGRREFWQGIAAPRPPVEGASITVGEYDPSYRPWTLLENLGIKHHLYDGLLGALAKRYGWETWYIPVRCRHLGGQTAVGDTGYQEWAKQQTDGVGDHQFWEEAHRIGYDAFRDVLPIRV